MECEQSKSHGGGTITATDPEEYASSRRKEERDRSKSQERSTTRATDIEEQSHLRQRIAGTTLPSTESHGAHSRLP